MDKVSYGEVFLLKNEQNNALTLTFNFLGTDYDNMLKSGLYEFYMAILYSSLSRFKYGTKGIKIFKFKIALFFGHPVFIMISVQMYIFDTP